MVGWTRHKLPCGTLHYAATGGVDNVNIIVRMRDMIDELHRMLPLSCHWKQVAKRLAEA